MVLKNLKTVTGASRGRRMEIPTINIDPTLAKDLLHGVYAAWVTIAGKKYMGALHVGPRPVFKDSVSFEVHVLDADFANLPETVDLAVIEKIRDIEDFPSVEALKERIAGDIRETRAILSR